MSLSKASRRCATVSLLLLVPLLPSLGQNGRQRPDQPPRETNEGLAEKNKLSNELKLEGDKETKVEGKLTLQDPRDKVQRGSPHHRYEVKLTADTFYRIDLMSEAFDAFLRLEDSAGKELASDDDGGEGTNSRMVFKAPKTGTYHIVATSFDGKDGKYVLTLLRITAEKARSYERVAEAEKLKGDVNKLAAKGMYAEAIPVARKILDIAIDLYGEKDWKTTNVRLNMRQLELLAKLPPEDRNELDTSERLLRQAIMTSRTGDYRQAAEYAAKSYDIRLRIVGKEHRDTASSAVWSGFLFGQIHSYAKAQTYCEQALAIRMKILGEQHPRTAECFGHLGTLSEAQGDFAMAQRHYERSFAINKETLGEGHSETITAINNLASILHSQGQYAAARPYYERALAINRKALGEQNPQRVALLLNLGKLLQDEGDSAAARPLFEQASAINKKLAGGQDNAVTAASLNNLGYLKAEEGDLAAARQYYEQSLAIKRKVLGEQHPDTALAFHNLGCLLREQGDHEAARRYTEQALAIKKAVHGELHFDTARTLNNLGALMQDLRDFKTARLYYDQALAINQKVLGEKHPGTVASIYNLGRLLSAQGNYKAARPYIEEAQAITLGNLHLAATGQSERQQLVMAESLRYQLDFFLSMAQNGKLAAEDIYAPVLAWKGAVFLRQRQMRLARDNPELTNLIDELQSTSAKLAHMAFAVPDPKKLDGWRRQLADLTQEREKLERELARRSKDFAQGQLLEKLTVADVKESLPAGAVLVDLLEYQHWTQPQKQQTKTETRLTAFVIRSGQALVRLDLGPAVEIVEAVDKWRTNIVQRRRVTADKDPAVTLRRLLWSPLEPYLNGAKTVLISPDGALGRAPLAALPSKEPEKYLIEEVALVVLPTPRLLPELLAAPSDQRRSTQPSMLLAGGVDYDAAAAKIDLPLARNVPRSGALLHWDYLRGTDDEILSINKSFEKHFGAKGVLLQKDKASKAAILKQAPKHSYLHLATHGFFAPKELKSALAPTSNPNNERLDMLAVSDSSLSSRGVTGHNPGLLSGIVLAGANRKPVANQDDGILTALAVMELDLRNVDLAVLSACETGLGETAGGEGLLGLQRAFQLAGVRTTVASLWQVDDRWTRELMERFYDNQWGKKMSRLEALREAQLWVIRDGPRNGATFVRGAKFEIDEKGLPPARTAPPFFWAAFVLSGDWR